MRGSSPNPEAGRWLRATRERLRLSTREVERLSRMLAEKKKNQEYCISHAWITEIENGEFTPSVYKLYTLSTIYQCTLDQTLGLFGIHIADLGPEQLQVPLPYTRLLGESFAVGNAPHEVSGEDASQLRLDETNLVSRMFSLAAFGGIPEGRLERAAYGYVGLKDHTLSPLIRPGSFVQIDAGRRKIEATGWSGIFDRPIYFVELREAYACCWCEEAPGHLLLVPFPHPDNKIREVRYPADAEVVGRVTAVFMRILKAS